MEPRKISSYELVEALERLLAVGVLGVEESARATNIVCRPECGPAVNLPEHDEGLELLARYREDSISRAAPSPAAPAPYVAEAVNEDPWEENEENAATAASPRRG